MCARLITFTALIMFASVTVVFSRPVHSSPCIFDNWLRGLCEMGNKATECEYEDYKTGRCRMCNYEDLKAGRCWMMDDFLHYPKKHSCRELVKLLKAYSLADCGPDNTAKQRKAIVPKTAQQGASANAPAKLSSDKKNRNPATAVGPIPTKEVQHSTGLTSRKRFWEEQIFQCKSGNDIYPSKKDDLYDPKRRYDPEIPKKIWETDYVSEDNCDDGDMAFFSGLLCAAGDPRGCNGVALAQETKSGRWWRSKRRIGEGQDAGYSSFSTEAGLGVLMYMVKTGDKNRFDPWLKFIADLPRTYGPLPSYCPHKECVFKIIDCPLFVTVASRFEETLKAVSVCDPLQYLHLPTPDQIATKLGDGLKQLIDVAARFETLHSQVADKFGAALGLPNLGQLLPTPTKELQKQSDAIFKAFREALEKILGPAIGEAAAHFAQQIALVNAVVNSIDVNGFKIDASGKIVYESGNVRVEGANVTVSGTVDYNPNGEHIAAAEVFLLRNLGYSGKELRAAASYAYQRDKEVSEKNKVPYNPFFEYLVNDRSARMLQQILKKCPSLEKPSVKRFQWFPERGEEPQPNGKPAWIESMYWDCIFLAHLYETPVASALTRGSSPFDPFGGLAGALGDVRRFLDKLTNIVNDIQSWIKKMETAARPDIAFCNANPNNELCKLIPPDLSFCDKNPNNEICKLPLPFPIPGGGGGGPLPFPIPNPL
jgi:hypothetical protein